MSQSFSSAIDANNKSDSTNHEKATAGPSSNQLDPFSHVAPAPKYPTGGAERNEPAGSIRLANQCQAILAAELETDANSGSQSERCDDREPKVAASNDPHHNQKFKLYRTVHVIEEDDEDGEDNYQYNYHVRDGNNASLNLDDNYDNQMDTDELNLLQTNRRDRRGGSNGANDRKHPIGSWTPDSVSQYQSGSQSDLNDYSALSVGASSLGATGSESPARISDSGIRTTSTRQDSTTSGLRGAGHPKRNISAILSMASEDLTRKHTRPVTSYGSSRRRSSLAFIPQMQVCPGDLLVNDCQLNQLVNQSDHNDVTDRFATIKKAKSHIWSPFKLCAHLESPAMRLLPRLEDVLRSHKPSIFMDEQLLRYKVSR